MAEVLYMHSFWVLCRSLQLRLNAGSITASRNRVCRRRNAKGLLGSGRSCKQNLALNEEQGGEPMVEDRDEFWIEQSRFGC
jgi:hypothetical protein